MKETVIDNKSGLYTIFLERLKKLDEGTNKEIISFPDLSQRLCPIFAITKQQCFDILMLLKEFGFIEIVPYHGIKIKKSGTIIKASCIFP